MATGADDVEWLLELMVECGAEPIVAGGWGIDALAGEPTREHRDLDVLVARELVEHVTRRLLAS